MNESGSKAKGARQEVPVAVRIGVLVVVTAFVTWFTLVPARASVEQTAIAGVVGVVYGFLIVRFGPRSPVLRNVLTLLIPVVLIALIAVRDTTGNVFIMWALCAAVGMNLGSGWSRSSARSQQ